MGVDILARAMASGKGGGASDLAIKVDSATDEISLMKSGEPIPDSGATLPKYSLEYDTATGGLTLTKDGQGVQGGTVALTPYGSPLKAAVAADMTDTDKVYVYTGSESGYENGHWYYYDSDATPPAWTDGGVYNAVSVVTDKTLTVEDVPADAKAVGDAVNDLKRDIAYTQSVTLSRFRNVDNNLTQKVNLPLNDQTPDYGTNGQLLRTKGNGTTEWIDCGTPTDEQTSQAVSSWLDEHPEATTTVQDHSLTYEKLVNGTLGFVTPQMFGAKCDGVTDDTTALNDTYDYAYNANMYVLIDKNIKANGQITIKANTISFNNARITAGSFSLTNDALLYGLEMVSLMSPSGRDEDILLVISGHKAIIEKCKFQFVTDNANALAIKGSSLSDIKISDCVFNKCSTNFSGCRYVVIDGCKFNMNYTNSGHECIQFTAFTTGEIINNEFYESENDFIDLYSAGMDCTVSGNTFDGCHSHSMIEAKTTIRAEGAPGGSSTNLGYCRRNIIANNHFKNLIAKDAGIYSFIGIVVVYDGEFPDSVDDYPGEDIIEGNIFEGCGRINDLIQPTFYGVCCFGRNTVISNNIVDIIEPVSTGKSACVLVGSTVPNEPIALKTQSIVVKNNVLGGNSFGVVVRASGPNINIDGNVGKSGHSLKYFISLGTLPNSSTIIDIDKILIKNNACSTGGYNSFGFMYSNANLTNFIISGNVTDKNMAFVKNLTKGIISGNEFDNANFGISLSGVITSVLFASNFFNTTASTAGSIFANSNTTFAYCTINGNLSRSKELLRFLGTGTTPVMIGNVVANAENNNIKTT